MKSNVPWGSQVNSFWRWLTSLWKVDNSPMQISAPTILTWPVQPRRGVRQSDAAGSGAFGASRDGGTRLHLGLDLISHPGDNVVAPCACEVTHIGLAYAGSSLGSIHLKGWDDWSGYTFKLLYCDAKVTVGEILNAGERFAVAQDVRNYYAQRGIDITCHVHFEVHDHTGAVDPLPLLEGGSDG